MVQGWSQVVAETEWLTKSTNIYYLTFYRNSLLAPLLDDQENSDKIQLK